MNPTLDKIETSLAQFKKIVDDFFKITVEMHDKTGEAQPMVFVKVKETSNIIATPFNPPDNNSKRNFMQVLGKALASKNLTPQWVVLAGEAYIRQYSKKENPDLENYRQGDLAKDSEAQEIVMVHGRTNIGKNYMINMDIKTRKIKKFPSHGETQSFLDLIFNPSLDRES